MSNEELSAKIANELSSYAESAWNDDEFKILYERFIGSVLDVLHKRPDRLYCVGSIALVFWAISQSEMIVREGNSRLSNVSRGVLAEMLKRYPIFYDGVNSLDQYMQTLTSCPSKTTTYVVKDAKTQEDRASGYMSFWSLMWLGHQLSLGMIKSEATAPVAMFCAKYLVQFQLCLNQLLTDAFGEGKESRTPIAERTKTGCIVPFTIILIGVFLALGGVAKFIVG